MAQYEMLPEEKEIGKWTLNYVPPAGGRFTGPLTVTNQRLLFDAQFNTTTVGSVKELMIYKGTWGYLAIPKNRIQKVDVATSLLKKKIVLTLDNGEVHTFDYGMLSVQKLAEAINAR
ncbi:MAG: hypothetical protein PHI34_11265 [Acidobacteriota bacterium]|nr:hypothetical protein [Acidobacteriota bacterium]